jgi:uncharacterized protein
MRRDELRQPLQRRTLTARLWSKRPGLLALSYALTLLAFAAGGYVAVKTPNPFAGEPVIVAKIPKPEEIITASTEPIAEAEPVETAEGEPKGKKPAYTIVRPVEENIEQGVEQDTEQQQAAVVIKPRNGLTPAPIEEVMESTSNGVLPRISKSGKRPSKVYARSISLNTLHSDSPKVVIILGGMGINADLTRRAARELPADVTFAFAPYGEDLQNQVNDARKQGHEVLLQVPLEPMGYPGTSPGPKTLLADGKAEENRNALHWHMARFTGYTGIINYMGGRFLSNPQAVQPLLSELKKRGLHFFEDGTMATTAVAEVAGGQAKRASIVLDGQNDPQAITAALALLEAEAEKSGLAIASGAGLPDTIDAIKEWAKDAAQRGIIIVPASAAFQARSG